jgi:hypothetical protein
VVIVRSRQASVHRGEAAPRCGAAAKEEDKAKRVEEAAESIELPASDELASRMKGALDRAPGTRWPYSIDVVVAEIIDEIDAEEE